MYSMNYDIQAKDENNKWVTCMSFDVKEDAYNALPHLTSLIFDACPTAPLVMRIFESVDGQTVEPTEVLHKRINVL